MNQIIRIRVESAVKPPTLFVPDQFAPNPQAIPIRPPDPVEPTSISMSTALGTMSLPVMPIVAHQVRFFARHRLHPIALLYTPQPPIPQSSSKDPRVIQILNDRSVALEQKVAQRFPSRAFGRFKVLDNALRAEGESIMGPCFLALQAIFTGQNAEGLWQEYMASLPVDAKWKALFEVNETAVTEAFWPTNVAFKYSGVEEVVGSWEEGRKVLIEWAKAAD
ncbi:MAG: hypothetical protein L6R41_003537 [Letrouitia leprolyta]|nr:MAG: hypothetical protein L6R41_003537 [Letrouitia leprolyta]